MATRKTAKKATKVMAGVDVRRLSEELGMPVKEGMVTAVRGRYFVKVGATKKELVFGDTTPESEIKALVGPVAVLVSGRTIVAVGKPPKRPWIVCYIPVPDLIKRIRQDLRLDLLNKYVGAGVIGKEVAQKIAPLG